MVVGSWCCMIQSDSTVDTISYMTNLNLESLDQHGITIHWRFWWHLRADFKPNIVRLQLLHRIEIVRTGDMVMQHVWSGKQAGSPVRMHPTACSQVCSTTTFYPKNWIIMLDILVSTNRRLTNTGSSHSNQSGRLLLQLELLSWILQNLINNSKLLQSTFDLQASRQCYSYYI